MRAMRGDGRCFDATDDTLAPKCHTCHNSDTAGNGASPTHSSDSRRPMAGHYFVQVDTTPSRLRPRGELCSPAASSQPARRKLRSGAVGDQIAFRLVLASEMVGRTGIAYAGGLQAKGCRGTSACLQRLASAGHAVQELRELFDI
jgi:hypothetical protein